MASGRYRQAGFSPLFFSNNRVLRSENLLHSRGVAPSDFRPLRKYSPLLPPVGVWAVSQSQCGRSPSQVGYDRRLGEPLPHQLTNHDAGPSISDSTEAVFSFPIMRSRKLCGISTRFRMLSPLMGRLPTCYSPVRHYLLSGSKLPKDRSTCMY